MSQTSPGIHPSAKIHESAIVDSSAIIGANVEIGPWTLVGPEVEIGEGSVLHSHVVVKGPTTLGRNNEIFQFASIGEDCQDKKYSGEPTRLVVGDNNVFRESCTIHRGTVQDESLTLIGSDNLFMAYTHVGHDCVIGNGCILANYAGIAGHVHIGDGAILSAMSGVHQFCRVGSYSMCAAGAIVLKDVPAFVMVSGHPAKANGMNFEGMKRRGYSKPLMQSLRKAYKKTYREGLTLDVALGELQAIESPEPELQLFIDSLKTSTRGIVR
ncbi:acyl-ACP--UDP-N-acetylglucosamine O-acyltransferase [Aestuariirhabdus sp. Z084]|uniref:acyl-ACP--UDP-N-acetylglucosamine O-acyltransferase n=1 Tax=Aestuariirhabdus haliotis TaxID=2918751 RepID=UPI00201B3CB8|nr:acyl-ACP--UDP-N-acetylglucosamine O-acyltransferase [Aestuariirhabdus haliotis]MCL6416373.1 acyl-ACP--UDP-N-acetylglucosamine O-acyltransferase [Aestuariirhabdus haliotis]MCL6420362.1 acyl-ACP--UDP-N-acetylglucosamine O-acyltransferase [Aestuariirhabdus haliotis]